MENEFEKSLDYLSLPQLQLMPNYQKICTLKILNLIVLDKKRDLSNEWPKCQEENLNHFKSSHFDWLKLIVDLKLKPHQGITTKPFKGIKLISFDIDQIKMILKMALYLNQEKLIEEELSELTSDHYQDPEIRELLGQISFRLGQFKKSYRFVEGLESPNAENIKGNLYILRKKYELAYAQFKLALQKKLNSQNAMERILPLAWFLGDWEEGAKVTEKVIASPQTQISKLTLLSAFYAQKGDYQKARQTLEHINSKSRKGQQIEVTQIYSFVSLMENIPNLVKKQASLSCDQYDLVNCWLGYQMERWDAFPLVLRREDKISYKKDWQKLSASKINEPIKEQVFVNQLDIEELDDKLIKLIPDAENN
jgi:tetratricopeptide (TPR) repeat protein